MLSRNNQQIIDDIFIRCSERLDKQLYSFENILGERETLALLEDSLYFYVAGNILLLQPDGSDTSNNPELVAEKYGDAYEAERKIVGQYLTTLIHFEVANNHEDALAACIRMLETTVRTYNREFLNIIYLIILFDKDDLYKHLCRPLAVYCVNIIYNDYNLSGDK